MKTSHGKLAALAFALLLAALLFVPMRAGREDELILKPGALKMSVGGSYQISCTLSSDEPGQTLRYMIEDAGVVTISGDGTVTALAPGETTITAQASGGARASMRVLVDGTPLTELSLNTNELYMDKGQISGLRVSYNSDTSDARLQWISQDESIARVDASGRIEGVGGGQTYVSVIAPNGMSASAKVYGNVDGTAAHIRPNGLTLGVGAQVPLKLSFLPEDCTDAPLRWSSSNPSVLTVDENGLLCAKGEGRAYVSALTRGGLTTGMEVLVEAAPKDIRMNLSAAAIERGDELQLALDFLDKDGSLRQDVSHLVVWSSDDESVATVDENGRVTALKGGKCEITAASDGMSASCELEVQVNIREITLDKAESYLLKEETGTPIRLGWTISPADADDPSISFSSDNTQVAQVSQDGVVRLTGGYGTAVITASSRSGASASFTVHVVTQLPDEAQAAEAFVQEELAQEVWEEAQATAIPAAAALPEATYIPAATELPAATENPASRPASVG